MKLEKHLFVPDLKKEIYHLNCVEHQNIMLGSVHYQIIY